MGGKAKAWPRQQKSAPVGVTAMISSTLRKSNNLTSSVGIITVMHLWEGMNCHFQESHPEIGGILARGCASGYPCKYWEENSDRFKNRKREEDQPARVAGA